MSSTAQSECQFYLLNIKRNRKKNLVRQPKIENNIKMLFLGCLILFSVDSDLKTQRERKTETQREREKDGAKQSQENFVTAQCTIIASANENMSV